jgi:hypothetical protein
MPVHLRDNIHVNNYRKSPNQVRQIMLRFWLLALILTVCNARAADNPMAMGKPVWQHSAPSIIQTDSKGIATVTNHRYLLNSPHRCYPNTGESIVVSQRTTWRYAPIEGNNPNLEAIAYRVTPDGKSTTLWTIKDNSDEGKLHCDYYETVWYGCCSAMPNHRLYNPKNGKLLMEYSDRLLTVEIPNSPLKRFIGYKPSETIQLNPWEKHKHHIGTLTYASPNGILHRIVIRGIGKVDSKFEMGAARLLVKRGHPKQEMGDNTLRLWQADGAKDPQQIGGFTIVLKYQGTTIELPVEGDDFAIRQSKFTDHEIIRMEK